MLFQVTNYNYLKLHTAWLSYKHTHWIPTLTHYVPTCPHFALLYVTGCKPTANIINVLILGGPRCSRPYVITLWILTCSLGTNGAALRGRLDTSCNHDRDLQPKHSVTRVGLWLIRNYLWIDKELFLCRFSRGLTPYKQRFGADLIRSNHKIPIINLAPQLSW